MFTVSETHTAPITAQPPCWPMVTDRQEGADHEKRPSMTIMLAVLPSGPRSWAGPPWNVPDLRLRVLRRLQRAS